MMDLAGPPRTEYEKHSKYRLGADRLLKKRLKFLRTLQNCRKPDKRHFCYRVHFGDFVKKFFERDDTLNVSLTEHHMRIGRKREKTPVPDHQEERSTHRYGPQWFGEGNHPSETVSLCPPIYHTKRHGIFRAVLFFCLFRDFLIVDPSGHDVLHVVDADDLFSGRFLSRFPPG